MIRFFNGRTLTMAHGVTVTTDEVWTDGDKIAYVGPAPETLPAFEREIDLGGDLVMPGFKNAHAHAGMSFVRSYADDVPLQPWLFEQIFPLIATVLSVGMLQNAMSAGGQAHARGGVCVYEAVDPRIPHERHHRRL